MYVYVEFAASELNNCQHFLLRLKAGSHNDAKPCARHVAYVHQFMNAVHAQHTNMMCRNATIQSISILTFCAVHSGNQISITTCLHTYQCVLLQTRNLLRQFVVFLACSKYLAKATKIQDQEKMDKNKWLAR